jgi:hypothetical protein
MKPGDHPEFYRFPAPEGRSRESSIVLDGQGVFWHDGARVERPQMSKAFFRWIRRHPDDGRFILSNDYDWTYIEVEDVPFFVTSARVSPSGILLCLSDGTEELLDLSTVRSGPQNALYCDVKQGRFRARFQQSAQLALADALSEDSEGRLVLTAGDQRALLT